MVRPMFGTVLTVVLVTTPPAILAASQTPPSQVRPPVAAQPVQPPTPPQAPAPQTPPVPAPAPKPEPAPAPKANVEPSRGLRGQPVNVRVEFTITDQEGAQAPIKKTVTLMLADRESGMIRSETQTRYGRVRLNVDAEVMVLDRTWTASAAPAPELTGKILAQVGMTYDLVNQSQEGPRPEPTAIGQSLRTVLDDGKPQVISESADPITDRKVIVEVKATILR